MAGHLTEKFVLENLPRCSDHDMQCVIKTGTKNNANNGKSFYICNNSKERCSYAKPAKEVVSSSCPIHQKMVELKAFAEKSDGVKCYFRCTYGREIGMGWCGNSFLKKETTKLRDITNTHEQTNKNNQNIIKKNSSSNLKSSYSQPNNVSNPVSQQVIIKQDSSQDQVVSKVHTNLNDQVNSRDQESKDSEKSKDQVIPNDSSHRSIHQGTVNPHVYQIPKTAELNMSVSESETNTGDKNITSNTANTFHIPKSAEVTSNYESENHSICSDRTSSSNESNESMSEGTSEVDKLAEVFSNTIEIVSSDDDESDNTDKKLKETLSLPNYESPLKETDITLADLKMTIIKQQQLYEQMCNKMPDGGKKIQENIKSLVDQYNNLQKIKNAEDLSKHQKQTRIEFPKMAPTGGTINLGLNHPNSLYNMAAQQRAAPLFGGRMTETRLKEVGRITKDSIEELHKSLDTCPSPTDESEDPQGLNVTLMTHQKQALLWLLWRERQKPSGGILADDMGLGKTLTMISLTLKSKQDDLSFIKEKPKDCKLQFSKATVIICPASLVHQWNKEIEKRVNKSLLKVCLYHGPNREKRIKRLAGFDIVLTTYNICAIEGKPFVNAEKDKPKAALSEWLDSSQPKKVEEGPLFKIFWRRIVLDEGHNIKNHKTGMSIAVSSLESESRWIVTGTPIQNHTMDLYSLVKFLRVSPFDELKVWKREVDNKSNSGTKRMNSIVNSILLRRTKDQNDQKTGKPLVSLPKRNTVLHKLKLSKDETCVYELIQKFSKNTFTQYLDNRKDGGHSTAPQAKNDASNEMPTEVLGMNIEDALTMFGLRGVNATNAGCLLVLVLRLRQCCGHLSLMCEQIDPELCKSEGIDIPLDEQFGNMSIDQDSPLFKNHRPSQLNPTFSSTKIATIIKILKDLQETKDTNGKPIKSVIVSQWTRMLDIIAHHLKLNGFKYDFITGSVNAKKRADLVEAFNTEKDPQVMLVSLKAGGVGLNLIGGSNLFLIDQHWNPALEDQACDRIYRVGQINDVTIHRFLCVETVEERIVQLQERKKSLANSVLYGGKTQKLTLDDLKVLFGV